MEIENDQEHSDNPSNNENELIDSGEELEAIYNAIGGFGRFQMYHLFILGIPMMFNAMHLLSYTFTANPAVYRCNITECDDLTSGYWEPWVNFTIPKANLQYDKCSRYVYQSELENQAVLMDPCSEEYFNKTETETCSDGLKILGSEHTVASEFELFCSQERMINRINIVNGFGKTIGTILGGVLSDKFGRRTVLVFASIISCLLGTIQSFSENFFLFIFFELLAMIFASMVFPAALTLAIESVERKRRVIAVTIVVVFYNLGEAILGILAENFQNWRVLLKIIYIPAALQIYSFIDMPESIHWLLGKGREEECAEILRRVALDNRKPLPEIRLATFLDNNKAKLQRANEANYAIWQTIRKSFNLILTCSFCWYTHTIDLFINSVNLDDNIYHNFIYNGLIQIPGLIVPIFIMDYLGRKKSFFSSTLAWTTCIIVTLICKAGGRSLNVIFVSIGTLTNIFSFHIFYIYALEMFPTNVRNTAISICSACGYTPAFIVYLIVKDGFFEKFVEVLLIVYVFTSSLFVLLWPETGKATLPSTKRDVDKLHAL